MISDIFNYLFSGVLGLMQTIIGLVITPIDFVIRNIIPSFDIISENVYNFLNYFYDDFLFVINWIHIPTSVITLILAYITFRLTIFFGTFVIKLFIKWYNYLKL